VFAINIFGKTVKCVQLFQPETVNISAALVWSGCLAQRLPPW